MRSREGRGRGEYRSTISQIGPSSLIRRRQVPDRIVGNKVVVARPGVDEALVLAGAAALVWVELDRWMSEAKLWDTMMQEHPEVDGSRRDVLTRSLRMLDDQGLLERRDH